MVLCNKRLPGALEILCTYTYLHFMIRAIATCMLLVFTIHCYQCYWLYCSYYYHIPLSDGFFLRDAIVYEDGNANQSRILIIKRTVFLHNFNNVPSRQQTSRILSDYCIYYRIKDPGSAIFYRPSTFPSWTMIQFTYVHFYLSSSISKRKAHVHGLVISVHHYYTCGVKTKTREQDGNCTVTYDKKCN